MTTGIIIFLSAAVAALAVVLAFVTAKQYDAVSEYEAADSRIAALIEEKDTLLLKNIELSEYNEELRRDNDTLADAVRELREINKQLTAPAETEPEPEPEPSLLPEGHTNTYRCEDYRLFNPNSDQYRLQRECYTSETTGIRIYHKNGNKYLCAAMATAYGTQIGRTYRIQLRNGIYYNIIVADFKHPIDNVRADDYGDPDTNYDGNPTTSIIEFVVDMDAVPEIVRQAGTMSALEEFGGLFGDNGDIVEIVDTGRKWKW